jgi:hypothetical protein
MTKAATVAKLALASVTQIGLLVFGVTLTKEAKVSKATVTIVVTFVTKYYHCH